MSLPQITWPGVTGPPQGPLPTAPPIPPDETATPPDQLPLEPARPKAPQPVFAATAATPYPSHAHYGSNAVVVATAKAALGPGPPAQRWWAGLDSGAVYFSGLGKQGLLPPPTPPFVVGPPMPPTPPVPELPPPYSPPSYWPPVIPPVELPGALTWYGQNLTWRGQIMTWGM